MKANACRRAGERMIVLEAIATYTRQHGQPPLVREVFIATAIGTLHAVSDHIKAMLAEGYLTREPSVQRSLRLTMEGEYALKMWQGGGNAS